ncbi:MAG: hypothetical protein SFV15_15890 [Polyangiaceae bacterium]|nr:hypothetical protein [Polyangiaceae bacterium]
MSHFAAPGPSVRMKTQFRNPQMLGSLALLFLANCSGEAELFDAQSLKLAEKVGLSCTLEGGPFDFTTRNVEENPSSCGLGVCLGFEAQVYCSCRCDGPESEAPFCRCRAGFECRRDVIVDLGGTDLSYVGGYCVKPSVPAPVSAPLEPMKSQ